jgi:hypothetical protein
MLLEIGRGDRTHQTPDRITQQADGDNEKDCRPRRLAGNFIESAVAVGGSGRATVKSDVRGEVGDQQVENRPSSESRLREKLEPTTAFDIARMSFDIGYGALCRGLRSNHS